MRVSFQRDREGDLRRTVGQVRDHPNTQLVVQTATDAATDICWNELGLTASSSLRDVRGDVVMEEAPPPPQPAEPPPVLRTSEEADAMTLAAVHRYGHEEPLEISRTEFQSFVRDGFHVEEDTLEELPLDEVVEGVNRELDLMKSFPVYLAVPRAEVTGKVWSTRWCYRRKGPKQVRARFVARQFANSLDANFYIPTLGSRSRECCQRWL